jgi:phosphatidyl-myo-inositol dimannoside synthase
VNILALVTEAWNGRGGIARYNRDLLGALAQHPAVESIQVLARHVPDAGEELPGKVRMSGALGKVGFALHALAAAAQLEQPFIVFCGHIHFVPLAAVLGRLRQAPVWLQVHGIEAWQRPSPMRAFATERVQLITAVSRHTRRRLLSWTTQSHARVRVLPNTVEERFSPGPKREDLLARFALEGKKVLLTVGRLSAQEQYKGHDRVICALPELLTRHPEVCYLVVGDGDDRGRLETLAQQTGVPGHVVFTGAVTQDELPDYYRLADVFVMPSTGEGFGIAFVEAAAAGLLVVGCGVDGSRDALREGQLGAMAAPSPGGVFAAVHGLLSSVPGTNTQGAFFQRKLFNQRSQAMLGGIIGQSQ